MLPQELREKPIAGLCGIRTVAAGRLRRLQPYIENQDKLLEALEQQALISHVDQELIKRITESPDPAYDIGTLKTYYNK